MLNIFNFQTVTTLETLSKRVFQQMHFIILWEIPLTWEYKSLHLELKKLANIFADNEEWRYYFWNKKVTKIRLRKKSDSAVVWYENWSTSEKLENLVSLTKKEKLNNLNQSSMKRQSSFKTYTIMKQRHLLFLSISTIQLYNDPINT